MQVTVKEGVTVKESRQGEEMCYTFHFRTPLPLGISRDFGLL